MFAGLPMVERFERGVLEGRGARAVVLRGEDCRA